MNFMTYYESTSALFSCNNGSLITIKALGELTIVLDQVSTHLNNMAWMRTTDFWTASLVGGKGLEFVMIYLKDKLSG